MRFIKRVLISGLIIALVVGIGLSFYRKKQEQQMMNMVISGQIMIDQVMHEWNVCQYKSPVGIEMYVRNKGAHTIYGNLVFW